jgi:hypothetical protein
MSKKRIQCELFFPRGAIVRPLDTSPCSIVFCRISAALLLPASSRQPTKLNRPSGIALNLGFYRKWQVQTLFLQQRNKVQIVAIEHYPNLSLRWSTFLNNMSRIGIPFVLIFPGHSRIYEMKRYLFSCPNKFGSGRQMLLFFSPSYKLHFWQKMLTFSTWPDVPIMAGPYRFWELCSVHRLDIWRFTHLCRFSKLLYYINK